MFVYFNDNMTSVIWYLSIITEVHGNVWFCSDMGFVLSSFPAKKINRCKNALIQKGEMYEIKWIPRLCTVSAGGLDLDEYERHSWHTVGRQ